MPNFNVLEAIDQRGRFDFSMNFEVARPTVLDTIFPDVKTQYWQAEYYRLMQGTNLPDVAFVHALDTEAEIGQRPSFEKFLTEELFIKRKINQSERLQQAINNGVPDNDALINWVFNDSSNLFEGVLARTKVMKAQALSEGIIKVDENNVKMNIDFKVPAENKLTFGNWSDPEYDIFGDLEKANQIATENGAIMNRLLTSGKNISYMRKNKSIQIASLGANNARMLTMAELSALVLEEFGWVMQKCDEQFKYKKATGVYETKRYYDEKKVTIYEASPNGSFGIGLWGPTPEENEYRQFLETQSNMFITLSMWATEDPVAKWTKASGMFVPVIPNPYGMVIGTVTVG